MFALSRAGGKIWTSFFTSATCLGPHFPLRYSLQLIRDQSVTMRDPQQISDNLDSLVKDVEQTEETVREVESIFELSPLASPEIENGPSTRSRVRY